MKYLLGERLQFDWKVVSITIVSTLLLMVDYYHKLTPNKYWDRVILYLLVPLLIIVLFFRENPKNTVLSRRLESWIDYHRCGHFVHGTDYLLLRARGCIHA